MAGRHLNALCASQHVVLLHSVHGCLMLEADGGIVCVTEALIRGGARAQQSGMTAHPLTRSIHVIMHCVS
jgi:hypothetical protein